MGPAPSLPAQAAITHQIITAYRKRMQVQEGFRDAKSPRYGFGLDQAFSRSKGRYSVLLLIIALAALVAWLMGKIAHQKEVHKSYQANTITHRLVLSFVHLGRRIAVRGGVPISGQQLRTAREHIRVYHFVRNGDWLGGFVGIPT